MISVSSMLALSKRQLLVPKTIDSVVVDDFYGLHEDIDDGRPNEAEAAPSDP